MVLTSLAIVHCLKNDGSSSINVWSATAKHHGLTQARKRRYNYSYTITVQPRRQSHRRYYLNREISYLEQFGITGSIFCGFMTILKTWHWHVKRYENYYFWVGDHTFKLADQYCNFFFCAQFSATTTFSLGFVIV